MASKPDPRDKRWEVHVPKTGRIRAPKGVKYVPSKQTNKTAKSKAKGK